MSLNEAAEKAILLEKQVRKGDIFGVFK